MPDPIPPIHSVDPEMSAAGKARAAKQPRQAGGKFASTTNAQEQEVIDLKAQIAGLVEELNTEQQRLAVARETFDNIHALLQLPISASVVEAVRHLRGRADRALELEEKASEMNARAAELEENIRLLAQGNKNLTNDRDHWRQKAESQRDTIQGDRKQINTMRADCERHLADLAHANLLVGQGEAEREKLKQQVGNLTHDRDAMTAEVDRLTDELTVSRRGRDELIALLSKADASKTFAQISAFVVMIVGAVIIVAQAVTGGAK